VRAVRGCVSVWGGSVRAQGVRRGSWDTTQASGRAHGKEPGKVQRPPPRHYTAACSNPERGTLSVIFRLGHEQRRDEALDLARVESQ
jgi:hypothetical protein